EIKIGFGRGATSLRPYRVDTNFSPKESKLCGNGCGWNDGLLNQECSIFLKSYVIILFEIYS
ncbi:MAG: hypothetical protein VB013_05100, partial [Anaerolineaceae bacterium]|nr:hypothetical protein [Anaerolineaceae bacterium]